jgi:hypothetical protein
MDWLLSAAFALGIWSGPALPEYRDTCPPMSQQERAKINQSLGLPPDQRSVFGDAGEAYGQRLCQALEKKFHEVLRETWGHTSVSLRRQCIDLTRKGAAELGQPQGYFMLGSCVAFMKPASKSK